MSKNWSNLANFTIFKCEFGSKNFEIKNQKNVFVVLDPNGKKAHYAVFPEKYFADDVLP